MSLVNLLKRNILCRVCRNQIKKQSDDVVRDSNKYNLKGMMMVEPHNLKTEI